MMPNASRVFQAEGRDSTVTFSMRGEYTSAKAPVKASAFTIAVSLPSGVLRRNRQFGARDRRNESRGSSVALARSRPGRAFGSDCPDERKVSLCLREYARAENVR